jgi:hypothetical protein
MNAAIKFHPLFPLHGTHQEKEAFVKTCTEKIAKIHAANQAAQMLREQTRTKRIVGLVQEFVPKVASVCQAVNLNNTPCKFKATCGRFCKKHKISAKDLDLVEELY